MSGDQPSQDLVDDLVEWLRIPSISTDDVDPEAMRAAAEWVCERVRAAGGEAALDTSHGGNPLAVGDLSADAPGAPTVLIYGHYDVQSPGDLGAWDSPPFEPEIREGRIYARGAADDKGNFLPLLRTACDLAAAGELPVNVRVLVEGEEEVSSAAVSSWIAADERGADCAVVFDAGPADARTPAITVALRGIVMVEVEVRTAPRHLHSGSYGGSVLNSLHVLHAMLSEVVPGPDGLLSEELRAGIVPPTPAEVASWERLKPGDEVLAEVGGRPGQPRRRRPLLPPQLGRRVARRQRDRRRGAAHGRSRERAGDPEHAARAGPGRGGDGGDPRAAAPRRRPRGTPRSRSRPSRTPRRSAIPPRRRSASPPRRSREPPAGVETALIREGGSIPVVADLLAAGMPTIVTGFSLPEDAYHAPNESYALSSLAWGERAARELFTALAELTPAA